MAAGPSTAWARTEPRASGAADFAARALARCHGARVVMVTVPAPVVDPLVVFRLGMGREPVAWLPPEGGACVGFGAARTVVAAGPARFAQVQRAVSTALDSIVHERHAAAPPFSPRFFGGFGFSVGSSSQPPWSAFGDASFVLPRWSYRIDQGAASLSLTLGAEDMSADLTPWVEHLARTLDDLEVPLEPPVATCHAVRVEHLSKWDWKSRITEISRAISEGTLSKVVAARCSTVELDRSAEPVAMLDRLRESFPGCTVFAVSKGGSTFLGATPERLVSRRGSHVVAEALAGSVPTAVSDAAEQLLSSPKDQAEHAFVADMLTTRLRPFCREVKRSPVHVRSLPHLLHLRTTVRGELAAGAHILELSQALHPTPAVGGVPTEGAVDWIVEHESTPRGWYAGPVGWVDGSGHGDMAVALRSGLLAGNRAWVYAGAGIVRESEPHAEYLETELKLRAIFDALGVTL